MPLAPVSTIETTITNTQADVARVPDLVANVAATHHSDDRVHKIQVRLTVSKNMVVAEIEDDGQPFDPLTAPPPDLDAPFAERQPGRLGVHFIRSLMSEVTYSRVAGRNRLVLKRRLDRGKEENSDGTT